MEFLYVGYREKQQLPDKQISSGALNRVHAAPVEHPVVYWCQRNLPAIHLGDAAESYDFPKEKVEELYQVLSDAHAEKKHDSPRPWKFMPIPAENEYPYHMASYEKEYGGTYYDSLYKYITVLGVILNIFDFDKKQLIAYVQ